MGFRTLSEEWVSTKNIHEVRESVIPARVDYEDEDGTRFEARFEILYHGGFASYNPDHRTIAECRSFTYRRIPNGIKPSELPSCAQISEGSQV
jgi:hypothetical protein